MKNNISAKMLFFIIIPSIIIYGASIGYISITSQKTGYQDAIDIVKTVDKEYASKIEARLNTHMAKVKTLAQSFKKYSAISLEQRKQIYPDMYESVFEANPDFISLWDSWELSNIDSTYDKPFGRYVYEFYREGGEINKKFSYRSMDGDPADYARIKEIGKDAIEEPYYYSYTGKEEDQILETSLIVPMLDNGNFIGVVGVDISLDVFNELIKEIKPFDRSYAYLVSNKGAIVAHPNISYIGKSMDNVETEKSEKFDILNKIQKGLEFSFTEKDNNEDYFYSFYPIKVGETLTPWSIAIAVPTTVITKQARNNFYVSIFVGLLGLLIIVLIIWYISRSISIPLRKTTDILQKLAQGKISHSNKLNVDSNDELGDMAKSVNTLIEGLNSTAEFAQDIGAGKLEEEFNLLSNEDVLGTSLLEMRGSLKHAKEEDEKRKLEEGKQKWVTNGLAKLGDVMRQNANNIKELSFSIISNLCNYLDATQGALYILNDNDEEDIYYELISAIAYGRDKLLKKQYRSGESLVGRCAHERMTIYMTDLPDDYIKISSGMGTANPDCVLLVPLLLNNDVFGVIEIASFGKFEPHQIEFIEKVGESIASTISSVKINARTARLLSQSQQQGEELAAQEEEMRQNLEEMQATQEEASRKEFEMQGLIHALSSSCFTVEYDMNGYITAVNDSYADFIGVSKDRIKGVHHKDGFELNENELRNYSQFCDDLKNGVTKKDINKVCYNDKTLWLSETYSPIFDKEDKVYKVLKIAFDITDLKLKAEELEKKADEIENDENKLIIKAEELELVKQELKKKDQEQEKIITDLQKKLGEINSVSSKKTETIIKKEREILKEKLLVEWKNDLVIGIDELDQQHKKLVDIANQLFVAFKKEKGKKEIKEIIKGLSDYASYHFSTEENYFNKFSFSDTKSHINEHQVFIKEIINFQNDFNKGKVRFLDDFMTFVKSWIVNHFTNVDKKYVDLFIENGLS
ncbi:MAG: bacteriohemerythrin [Bacteroidetes bacterium]|nr:bacteriohemerythrin [Bacteroidota bacterium]